MRIVSRNNSHGWDLGIALAMSAMVALVLALLLNLSDRPLSADTQTSSAPPTLYPDEPAPQFFPVPTAPSFTPVRAASVADVKFYQGQKYRFTQTLTLRVTAYAPDRRCTFPFDGTTTASGLPVTTNGGHLVAADTSVIPMHALVIVPGYAGNAAVPVLDRGSAIKGPRLDILLPTFNQAKSWGVRTLQVKIYQP